MGLMKQVIEAAGEKLYPGNTLEAFDKQDAFMLAVVNEALDVDPADLQNIINGDEETTQRVKDQMKG